MRALAAAVLVLGGGLASAADIPRAEGFGGYSYARSSHEPLHGWSATLGYNFTRHLEVEAEVAAHYGTFDTGTDLGRQSFLAGPRLNFRAGRATPFLRALAGVVRTSAGITVQNVTISARDTALGTATGGGVDLALGKSWGLRLQGDYVMVRTDGEMVGDPRAAFG
ncbi:MAG TPA: outer membrane beta-barrel protein, partial [Vicinamibacteria bacterium]|nr:outer membrane beta-barrel protein [Vicinamibacteria bacterium]